MTHEEAKANYDHVIQLQDKIRRLIHENTRLLNCGLALGENAIEDAGECCDDAIADLFHPYLKQAREVLGCNLNVYRREGA